MTTESDYLQTINLHGEELGLLIRAAQNEYADWIKFSEGSDMTAQLGYLLRKLEREQARPFREANADKW